MTIKLFLPVLALLITFTASQALAQTTPSTPPAGSQAHSQTWENHQAGQDNDYQRHNTSYKHNTSQAEHDSKGGGYHSVNYNGKHSYKDDGGSWHNGGSSKHKGYQDHH